AFGAARLARPRARQEGATEGAATWTEGRPDADGRHECRNAAGRVEGPEKEARRRAYFIRRQAAPAGSATRAPAAAYRVLRHLAPRRHRHGGLVRSVRRRPATEERVPALQDPPDSGWQTG